MMKKSLNGVHTHSGYSALKKNELIVNELALVGTRISSVSMTGSLTSLPLAPGQSGADGNRLLLADSQLAGTEPPAPWMLVPSCQGRKSGSDASTALPVDSTTRLSPKRGVLTPNVALTAACTLATSGSGLPLARVTVAAITPHR